MAGWQVTEQAIAAMNDMSVQLQELASKIHRELGNIKSTFEENQDGLGAHFDDISELINSVEIAEQGGNKAVAKLQLKLIRAALIRQKHIEENKYGNNTGGTVARTIVADSVGIATGLNSNSGAQKYRAVHRDPASSNKTPTSLSEVNDFDSLSNYMDSKYGIQIDFSMKSLDLGSVKGAISGVESIINEYPDVGELLKKGITSNSGVMSCSGSKLSFNPDYFGDNHTLTETCKEMSDRGFWVSNSSPKSIGAHEAAHGVEWALIQANSGYTNDYERIHAWNRCREASKIVSQACDNIKKTPYGQGKSQTELIQSISQYGIKDDSETMAEAFADVYANGVNANPLSKEIKRIAKEQMDSYKGVLIC